MAGSDKAGSATMDPQTAEQRATELRYEWWQVFLDPSMIILSIMLVFWLWIMRASPWGKGWLKKQSDYLDHQRSVTDRIVDQNRSYEAMIARQYSETNQRTDLALQMSEEANRLHRSTLDELSRVSRSLERLADSLAAGSTGRQG